MKVIMVFPNKPNEDHYLKERPDGGYHSNGLELTISNPVLFFFYPEF